MVNKENQNRLICFIRLLLPTILFVGHVKDVASAPFEEVFQEFEQRINNVASNRRLVAVSPTRMGVYVGKPDLTDVTANIDELQRFFYRQDSLPTFVGGPSELWSVHDHSSDAPGPVLPPKFIARVEMVPGHDPEQIQVPNIGIRLPQEPLQAETDGNADDVDQLPTTENLERDEIKVLRDKSTLSVFDAIQLQSGAKLGQATEETHYQQLGRLLSETPITHVASREHLQQRFQQKQLTAATQRVFEERATDFSETLYAILKEMGLEESLHRDFPAVKRRQPPAHEKATQPGPIYTPRKYPAEVMLPAGFGPVPLEGVIDVDVIAMTGTILRVSFDRLAAHAVKLLNDGNRNPFGLDPAGLKQLINDYHESDQYYYLLEPQRDPLSGNVRGAATVFSEPRQMINLGNHPNDALEALAAIDTDLKLPHQDDHSFVQFAIDGVNIDQLTPLTEVFEQAASATSNDKPYDRAAILRRRHIAETGPSRKELILLQTVAPELQTAQAARSPQTMNRHHVDYANDLLNRATLLTPNDMNSTNSIIKQVDGALLVPPRMFTDHIFPLHKNVSNNLSLLVPVSGMIDLDGKRVFIGFDGLRRHVSGAPATVGRADHPDGGHYVRHIESR